APYAWVVKEEQRDRGRLAYLMNQLMRHHIEVHQASAAFKIKEGDFPAGTYVVRMDQTYRNHAFNLLKVQDFPKDEPNTPYDDVPWTAPLLYGVEAQRVDDRTVLDAPVRPVTAAISYPGSVTGAGPVFALSDTGQETLLSARCRLGSVDVAAAEKEVKADGETYPAGSWIVSGPGAREKLASVAGPLGLAVTAGGAPP